MPQRASKISELDQKAHGIGKILELKILYANNRVSWDKISHSFKALVCSWIE